MPKGLMPAQAWAEANQKLTLIRAPYRLRERKGSPYICVRHLDQDGKELRQFSIKPLLTEDIADISEASRLCFEGARKGQWPEECEAGSAAPRIGFQELSLRTLAHIDSRLKASSSAHTRGHPRKTASMLGHVMIERLKALQMQVPLSAFQKSFGTLSAIGQVDAHPALAEILDVNGLVEELFPYCRGLPHQRASMPELEAAIR